MFKLSGMVGFLFIPLCSLAASPQDAQDLAKQPLADANNSQAMTITNINKDADNTQNSSTQANAPHTDAQTERRRADTILITSHPIFDESASNAFFIHRWANYLHIDTRESTVRKLLSFKEGDELTEKDLQEAQRLLRAEPYLRDATVNFAEQDPQADTGSGRVVEVDTWDSWSLLPTISASRTGGNSKFSFGIKEDNLLGRGIATKLRYQSSQDRTGYKLAFKIPLTIIPHGSVTADFYDNSDGQAAYLYVEEPFYTRDDDRMYSAEGLEDTRIDTLRQNGGVINEFEHDSHYLNLSYGWLEQHNDQFISRWLTGITKDEQNFANIDSYPNSELPEDRNFLYPWLGWQYLGDDYQVLTNVHLINQKEDYNLAWQHLLRLGLEVEDNKGNTPGYHLWLQSSRGFEWDDSLILLWLNAKGTFDTEVTDNGEISGIAEYFYQLNPKWTLYGKAAGRTSSNTYLDARTGLGDETGLRGYPNDYQLGDHQWLLSAEIRHYPNINLYQLADLGWVAFIDAGQAFGGQAAQLNEVEHPIGSVGIGARLYSTRSSYGSVAHIDLTAPLENGPNVDSWEWRFLVRDRF